VLRACRSIRSTSQRSSLGLWVRIGSSKLSRSLTLLSTNGSIQYPNTVRTFCFSALAESPLTFDQSNGIQLDRTSEILDGSFSLQAYIATIITSKFWFIGLYTYSAEAVALVVSISGNLHQRGSVMRTRGGPATSPSPTVSFVALPGACHPCPS